MRKLDAVRLALQRGDLAEAAKYVRLFELGRGEVSKCSLSPVGRGGELRASASGLRDHQKTRKSRLSYLN